MYSGLFDNDPHVSQRVKRISEASVAQKSNQQKKRHRRYDESESDCDSQNEQHCDALPATVNIHRNIGTVNRDTEGENAASSKKKQDIWKRLQHLQNEVEALQELQQSEEVTRDTSKVTAIPTNIDTKFSSSTVSEHSNLSSAQDDYLLQLYEIKKQLTSELHQYVNTVVFKRNKFHMTAEAEEKYCRHAVAIGMVRLPPGVSSQAFARVYSKVLRSRISSLRNNAQTNAKLKFEGEFFLVVLEFAAYD